jgi:sterol desaturase/sphingolipid hydroxylase (fatty acid hydroxylase superfamily)
MMMGTYKYMQLFSISHLYDDMPPWYAVVGHLIIYFVLEDTWNYFFHRLLHHPLLYQHIHKEHHTFTAPFGMVVEYAHPIETISKCYVVIS